VTGNTGKMADVNSAVTQNSQIVFINSELLCAVQFFYTQLPKNDLTSILSDFYTSDEIVNAKTVLFTSAKGACPDSVQPPVARRGSNKRYNDMDDIVSLFAVMDAKKAILPTYTAVNLSRLPTIPCSLPPVTAPAINTAVAALESSVQDIQKQMDTVLAKLDEMKTASSTLIPTDSGSVAASKKPVNNSDNSSQSTWADRANKLALSSEPFRPSTALQRKMFCGKRSVSGPVKVVPRMLICFAGRLDISTTAEDLQDYLSSVGIANATCRRLVPKNGMTFKTAAFRVSCSPEYKDLFYDETSWPEGCELRDWYVNNSGQASNMSGGKQH
jgi:hypothetical protein